MHKSHSFRLNSVQLQQKQTSEQIYSLMSILNIKSEVITKRAEQSNEQSKKILNQLIEIDKEVDEKLKNVYKKDDTKQWSSQMQKTIKGILSNIKQNQDKTSYKQIQKCRNLGLNCEKYEDDVMEQRKERQKEWGSLIDSLGRSIMKIDERVEIQRQETEDKLVYLEQKILDIDGEVASQTQNQIEVRKKSHEYLSKLIERLMEKLLL